MRSFKPNPFELGVIHYTEGILDGKKYPNGRNPYPIFSEKWALYNRGFNSCWLTKLKRVVMKCSHGTQFEHKCAGCLKDAVSRLRTMLDQPKPEATREQKQEFWGMVYRKAVSETPNPAY